MIVVQQQSLPTQDPLKTVVRETLKTNGQEHEGYVWAIRSLQDWADMAGVSTKTVSRRFGKPPYDTLRKRVAGRQATLVRIGKPDPNQPSRLAAIMAKIFRDSIILNDEVNAKQKALALKSGLEWKPKKTVTPDEYGCLIGLAHDWRAGWQVEIFKYAISPEGWKMTKALSKYKTEDLVTPLGETGGMIKLLPGKAHLFQKYPHIPTLRLFWMCAESAFVDRKLNGSLAGEDEAFWLGWWQDVGTDALLEWEPNWKGHFDPIKDVKG